MEVNVYELYVQRRGSFSRLMWWRMVNDHGPVHWCCFLFFNWSFWIDISRLDINWCCFAAGLVCSSNGLLVVHCWMIWILSGWKSFSGDSQDRFNHHPNSYQPSTNRPLVCVYWSCPFQGLCVFQGVHIHKLYIHPWKPTWHWKSTIFNRKCIFKWWILHCHVSFRGVVVFL